MSETAPEAGPPLGPGPVPDPAAGGTAPPPGASEAVPGRPRGRGRKIALIAAGSVVVLLGLGVALLPTILSSGPVRDLVARKASEAAGREVSLASLDVGWSATTVKDLTVRWGPAASDPVLLRVPEIRVPAGISAGLASRHDVGTIEIVNPELRIDVRELEKTLAAPPKPIEEGKAAGGKGGDAASDAAAKPLTPFSAKVSIREGTLLLVDREGKERRLGTFDVQASASSDGPAEAVVSLDLGTSGKLRLKGAATPFEGGRPVPPDALSAALEATLDALDLGALREMASAAAGAGSGLDELAGTLSGTASVKSLGPSGVVEGTASLRLAGLVAAGAALGKGVRVEEPEVSFDAGFRAGRDGSREVRDAVLTAKGVTIRGGAALAPDGGITGSLSVKAELHEIKARAPRLGLGSPWVLQGDLALEARATGDGKARRVTGSMRADGVQIAPKPGRLPLDEPQVLGEFDIVREGTRTRIDMLTLRSASAVLDASGSAGDDGSADLTAKAKFQLARVQPIAATFGFDLPGEFGGTAELDVRVLRAAEGAAAPPAESTAVLTVRNFSVLPPGEGAKPVREPLLEARLAAVPGKDSVEVRSLRLKGAGADVLVAGTASLDGKEGRLGTVEASLDLAKAAALAGSFGAPLPVRIAGTASWKGPVSWKDTFGAVSAEGGEASLRGLEVVLPAEGASPERVLREEEVRASVDAGASRAAGGGFDVTLRKFTVAARGLDASASGTVAADGTLDLKAAGSLGIADALRRAAEARFLEKDPASRGTLEFDLAVRGPPGAPDLALQRLESRDAEFDLKGSGKIAAKGAGDLEVAAGGDLGVLLDLAARAGFVEPVKGAAGKARARVTAKSAGEGEPLLVSLEAGVEGLRYPDASGGLPWTLKTLGVEVKATVDRKAESAAGDAVLRTDDGGAVAKWNAVYAAGRRSVDAKADLDMDLGGLCRSRPDLLPLEEMTVGRVKGVLTVQGPLADPFDATKLAGTARLSLDSVKTQPFELRDASVEAVFQGGAFVARSLAAKVNGGTVTGSATLGYRGAQSKHALDFKAEGVRIDPAMAFVLRQVVPLFAVGESGGVNGALRLDLKLEGQGASWEQVKPGLRGRGVLGVSDGVVTGGGIVGEVLEFVGGSKSFPFNVLTTEFEVRDERVWNERLTVDGKEHSMVIRGSTTFDGKLDYKVGAKALKMSKKTRERLKPAMDEEGNLPFTVGGTLSKPKVKVPDLKKILGAAADGLLERLKGKLGGEDDEKDK